MTDDDTMSAESWLAQAASGGLPEPVRQRWQPLRVGIVNLWEYDNAEFWFADGRLVLRGGNGAGKTKVLELTTLMLLRGEISPSVLDPFGSQHRTMRYNLLPTGEADDPRPAADSGLGYAWVEFGRLDASGQAHFYVSGLGASARRGTGTAGVTTWQLITRLRPGKDFQFSRAGRPIEHKELNKLEDITVLESATRYRTMLASDLFGLENDAYDNLTEMLKQLRKPKLGERINPATIADTLRDALPPLRRSDIEGLADGWDRLEKLRQAVDATKLAATQVAGFTRNAWLPWVRIAVRQRADRFAAARSELDDTTRKKNAAEQQLKQARKAVARLDERLGRSKRKHTDAETELRELLKSQAYRDAAAAAHRVEALKEKAEDLASQRQTAEQDVKRHRKRLTDRQKDADSASEAVARAENTVAGTADSLADSASAVGLDRSTGRHLPERDLAGLRADLQQRVERFQRLRSLQGAYQKQEHATEGSARALADREQDHDHALDSERAARDLVDYAVDELRQRIRAWSATATVVETSEERIESWCDLVAELTTTDAEPDRETPARAMRAHTDATKAGLWSRREELRRSRHPLAAELDALESRLADVKATTDLPPPEPTLWQRAVRPDPGEQLGAPLWRCVQPRGELTAADLSRLEATLAASGLLDAWLAPEGTLRTEDGAVVADAGLLAGTDPADGESLLAVLEPTPAGGVSREIIAAAVGCIGWRESPPSSDDSRAWLTRDGSWRLGVLGGRAAPNAPASYLGATARADAHRREIESLGTQIDGLSARIGELDTTIADFESRLEALDAEIGRIPREQSVTDAVATLDERRRQREDIAGKRDEASSLHRRNETRRDQLWADFSTYAGDHSLPLHDLDVFAAAIDGYGKTLGRLELAVRDADHLRKAAEKAHEELEHASGLAEHAEAAVARLTTKARAAEVRHDAAKRTLHTDHEEQLSHAETLDRQLAELSRTVDRLTQDLHEADKAATLADGTLSGHEERRQGAELERDAALVAWWKTYDAGLAQAVQLVEPERRGVETGRNTVAEARKYLGHVPDEQAESRAVRRCGEALHELKQQLLPNRDARVQDDPESGTLPEFLLLTHSESGWQPPDKAAQTLAEQVREQEASYDAEQQQILTRLLESTFIEHLKEQLDRTEETFAGINAQLASHPTRQGHAVRLRHEPDPADPDASTVVTALGQGYELLSPARQEMVRSFLARKIDDARAEASTDQIADWKDRLAEALDYRAWLRIWLEYRPGTQARWRPFDRAQHDAKSGGEKVVLLSQPLFAAIVVAYDAAADYAPRWMWLDEAMTGVDPPYKASFMGLTVSFNLDVMLTAHDEWCTYPTVPAVAVYDLAREPHLPGVDAQPHLWCGGELTDVVLPTSRVGEELNAAGGLFEGADTP